MSKRKKEMTVSLTYRNSDGADRRYDGLKVLMCGRRYVRLEATFDDERPEDPPEIACIPVKRPTP